MATAAGGPEEGLDQDPLPHNPDAYSDGESLMHVKVVSAWPCVRVCVCVRACVSLSLLPYHT